MKTKNSETEYPPTPELDKMYAVREKSQAIGEFLEWLETDYTIGQYDPVSDVMFATLYSKEVLLARFFEIDLNKIEHERRAVLDWHQKNNT